MPNAARTVATAASTTQRLPVEVLAGGADRTPGEMDAGGVVGDDASSSARSTAAALCGRADGSFAISRMTSAASAGGASVLLASSGAGGSVRCAATSACGERAPNG